MLPQANRLTKKKDFDTVFKGGKTFRSDFLMAKVLESNLHQSRFGFVVSKKISTKATIRNKVKRRLRQAMGDYIKTKIPIDVVIVALTGIAAREFVEIRQAAKSVLKKYI